MIEDVDDMFPAGTTFYSPDDINRVTIQFPDENSAIMFFEWCRDRVGGFDNTTDAYSE